VTQSEATPMATTGAITHSTVRAYGAPTCERT
jgi:hypothetical protein